jgi:hypothetical protein
MNIRMAIAATALSFAGLLGTPHDAEAIMADPIVRAPSLIEQSACEMVRSRIVRPDGSVAYRTVRRCDPAWEAFDAAPDCTFARERVVRPDGSIVFRNVRRCG